jgi:hypothetical protein
MKHGNEDRLPQDKDRHLDIPQESNRDKHINFLDIEDPGNDSRRKDKDTEERQKQWQEGIEEGKKARKDSE